MIAGVVPAPRVESPRTRADESTTPRVVSTHTRYHPPSPAAPTLTCGFTRSKTAEIVDSADFYLRYPPQMLVRPSRRYPCALLHRSLLLQPACNKPPVAPATSLPVLPTSGQESPSAVPAPDTHLDGSRPFGEWSRVGRLGLSPDVLPLLS